MSSRPNLQVAVVTRRERVPGAMSHWQPSRGLTYCGGYSNSARCCPSGGTISCSCNCTR